MTRSHTTLPFFPTQCRDVMRLLSESHDRRLGPVENVALRYHMVICGPCPHVVHQFKLMSDAAQRWSTPEADAALGADSTTTKD